MRSIALTFADPLVYERLHQAFPKCELVQLRAEQIEVIGPKHRLSAIVFDQETLDHLGITWLATLKRRFPALAVIALLRADWHLSSHFFELLELGRTGLDALLVAGQDDHPDTIQKIFSQAADSTIGGVMEAACAPVPASLCALNIRRGVVAHLRRVRGAGALAQALGTTLAVLRQELRRACLPPQGSS
ncbi:MAG: hypothetical protein KatS3mg081_1853 [Gemmatimonadales bacterium]|nr:MAG: hypothetical protein KatS3mg081_1853 [Gemmatimonadales bacterium]